MTLRSLVGRAAGLAIPGLDDYAFNRDRNKAVPESRSPRGGFAPAVFMDRDSHVLVVPSEGPGFPDWRSGTRNFYYEAWQSARERLGSDRVSVLAVDPGESPRSWHRRLRDLAMSTRATHIVTHIENDPGNPDSWSWDEMWAGLTPEWDGVLLGVMFDSAFDLVTMKSRRLARMSPNFVAVDICAPSNGVLVRGRGEVGPVTMPVSQESFALLKTRIDGITPEHDVSFIGALYPYRVAMIDSLRSAGIDVAVNPHRVDMTHDFASSRRNQPEWLDYMAGLASSRMTINFSRSSAGSFEQMKTRVVEATLAGTFLLTDDRDSSRRYFARDVEYGYFSSIHELPTVVRGWLQQEVMLEEGRRAAQIKAQDIALNDFWEKIDSVLQRRGLLKIS